MLQGTEVKSLRDSRADLKESYARIEGNEAWLLGLHISPYAQGNRANHDPLRPRKLLLHRGEINRLLGKIMEKGLTLVPLRLYFKQGRAKVELGLARGRKTLDKRHAIRDREERREVAAGLARADALTRRAWGRPVSTGITTSEAAPRGRPSPRQMVGRL